MSLSGGSANGGAVVDGVVVVPALNARVYGLALASGAILWVRVGGSVFHVQYQYAPKAFAGRVVALRIDHFAEAFEPISGEADWSAEVAGLGHLQHL